MANHTTPRRGPRLGAHMSIAGGYHCAADAAAALSMDTVQIFTKSNAQWAAKPLTDDDVAKFRDAVTAAGLTGNCAHASYLINPASGDPAAWDKSLEALVVEMERADRFGLDGVVLHPGAYTKWPRADGVTRVVAAIDAMHKRLPHCRTQLWLETTAGQGSCLGHRFEEVAEIVDRTAAPDRIGVCLDTCHLFAAGYDLRTHDGYEQTIAELSSTIGLSRVKAVHVNDSKHGLGSRKDRHEHIGEGELGLEPFRRIVNDPRLAHCSMFLETKKEDRDGVPMDEVNLAVLRGLAEPQL